MQEAAERITAVSTGSFVSNATATISSILIQPFGNSYVEIKGPDQAKPQEAPQKQPNLVPVDNSFKVIVYIVLVVSISAIIAAAVAAQFWTTPTPNQQRVFEALEWAYKLGIGAIIGLISGQASRKQ